MTADAFINTNILLYSVSTDENEAGKRVQARQVLVAPGWGLSVQVLQEFYVNVVRAPACAMTHTDAVDTIRELLRRPTVPTDAALLLEALRLKDRFQIS
jgi:predicted nucleic acid-binding protein